MKLAHLVTILLALTIVASAAPTFLDWIVNDNREGRTACADFKHAKPIQCSDATSKPSFTHCNNHQHDDKGNNAHQSTDMIHGWASRLDIEAEARTFDQRIANDNAVKVDKIQSSVSKVTFAQDSANPLLNMGTLSLASAWKWVSSTFFHHHEDLIVEHALTTKFTDTLPRFVTYGDSYVESNSFGVPDPKKLKGFTTYNIAFWQSRGGASDNVQEWAKASQAQQKAIVKAYNDQGIRLGMAVFGAADRPLSNGEDPYDLAKQIANFVKSHNLQGVDVDFEEYDKFEKRQATKWLIPLTRGLRAALPHENYYISHAPIAPLFNANDYPLGYQWVERRIGSLIDYYNVQFYNQEDHTTCHSTIVSGTNGKTALLQIHNLWNIPLQKIVLGKPAHEDDADDGYITPSGLGNCIAKYAVPAGWKAGCMWYEYKGSLQNVITPVKENSGL